MQSKRATNLLQTRKAAWQVVCFTTWDLCSKVCSAAKTYLRARGISLGLTFRASLRMRMRYCVILVSLCLFLCTRNLGQNSRCSSSCFSASAYCFLSRIFCHIWLGVCARSMDFMYRYILPFSSRMVAYRLLANGQLLRLHRPVTLYSFLQKLRVLVLAL